MQVSAPRRIEPTPHTLLSEGNIEKELKVFRMLGLHVIDKRRRDTGVVHMTTDRALGLRSTSRFGKDLPHSTRWFGQRRVVSIMNIQGIFLGCSRAIVAISIVRRRTSQDGMLNDKFCR